MNHSNTYLIHEFSELEMKSESMDPSFSWITYHGIQPNSVMYLSDKKRTTVESVPILSQKS